MMTPVYDEAITDWNTKSCSIDYHAVRKGLSTLLSNSDRSTQPPPPAEKHFIPVRFKQVKTYTPLIHYLLSSETHKSFLDGFKTYQNLKDFLAPTGIDVLWRQVKFDLKITNCEHTVLDGYIKEQSADHPTTATDEEK